MTTKAWTVKVGRLAVALVLLAGIAAHAAAPAGRYTVDVAAGIVTDEATGLIWQRCAAGMSGTNCDTGTSTLATHADAASTCASLSLGGWSSGWRLPTLKELQSIVDVRTRSPTIDTAAFPGTPSFYFWSSTPKADDATRAWVVDFNGAFVFPYLTGNPYLARCVR